MIPNTIWDSLIKRREINDTREIISIYLDENKSNISSKLIKILKKAKQNKKEQDINYFKTQDSLGWETFMEKFN